MNEIKASFILIGIDWNKAAKFIAENDLAAEDPQLARLVNELDELYRQSQPWIN